MRGGHRGARPFLMGQNAKVMAPLTANNEPRIGGDKVTRHSSATAVLKRVHLHRLFGDLMPGDEGLSFINFPGSCFGKRYFFRSATRRSF